jgi:hypothetical protein
MEFLSHAMGRVQNFITAAGVMNHILVFKLMNEDHTVYGDNLYTSCTNAERINLCLQATIMKTSYGLPRGLKGHCSGTMPLQASWQSITSFHYCCYSCAAVENEKNV